MEIIKISETFSLTDSLPNGWEVNGTVSSEVSGNIQINASLTVKEGEMVGSINYYKPSMGNVNVHYDVAEENRDAVSEYADTLIDTILAQLK